MKKGVAMDSQLVYQIVVAGSLTLDLQDWLENCDVSFFPSGKGYAVTQICGVFDQAKLLGFLRFACYRGFPLITVNLIE